MGKIGKFKYPDIGINDCIEVIRVIDDQFNGIIRNHNALAAALGHSSKTGAYNRKLAAVRRYGLIEGRGEIKLTDIAQGILHPVDNEEYQSDFKKAFFKIPLLREIYEKTGSKQPDANFWAVLMNITGVDRKIAKEKAGNIRNIYIEGISNISNVIPETLETGDEIAPTEPQKQMPVPEPLGGFVSLTLPDGRRIDVEQDVDELEILKNHIDILIKKIKNNPPEKTVKIKPEKTEGGV